METLKKFNFPSFRDSAHTCDLGMFEDGAPSKGLLGRKIGVRLRLPEELAQDRAAVTKFTDFVRESSFIREPLSKKKKSLDTFVVVRHTLGKTAMGEKLELGMFPLGLLKLALKNNLQFSRFVTETPEAMCEIFNREVPADHESLLVIKLADASILRFTTPTARDKYKLHLSYWDFTVGGLFSRDGEAVSKVPDPEPAPARACEAKAPQDEIKAPPASGGHQAVGGGGKAKSGGSKAKSGGRAPLPGAPSAAVAQAQPASAAVAQAQPASASAPHAQQHEAAPPPPEAASSLYQANKAPPKSLVAQSVAQLKKQQKIGKSRFETAQRLRGQSKEAISGIMVQIVGACIYKPDFFNLMPHEALLQVLTELAKEAKEYYLNHKDEKFLGFIIRNLAPVRIEQLLDLKKVSEEDLDLSRMYADLVNEYNCANTKDAGLFNAPIYETAFATVIKRITKGRGALMELAFYGQQFDMHATKYTVPLKKVIFSLKMFQETRAGDKSDVLPLNCAPQKFSEGIVGEVKKGLTLFHERDLDHESADIEFYVEVILNILLHLITLKIEPKSIESFVDLYMSIKCRAQIGLAAFVTVDNLLAAINAESNEQYLQEVAEAYVRGSESDMYTPSTLFAGIDTYDTRFALSKQICYPSNTLEFVARPQPKKSHKGAPAAKSAAGQPEASAPEAGSNTLTLVDENTGQTWEIPAELAQFNSGEGAIDFRRSSRKYAPDAPNKLKVSFEATHKSMIRTKKTDDAPEEGSDPTASTHKRNSKKHAPERWDTSVTFRAHMDMDIQEHAEADQLRDTPHAENGEAIEREGVSDNDEPRPPAGAAKRSRKASEKVQAERQTQAEIRAAAAQKVLNRAANKKSSTFAKSRAEKHNKMAEKAKAKVSKAAAKSDGAPPAPAGAAKERPPPPRADKGGKRAKRASADKAAKPASADKAA